MITLYDGSQINEGFGGLLNAPGYYFSGYEGVTSGSLNPVDDGDEFIYFFITGNWMNMQQMYNLHYAVDPPGTPRKDDPAWKYETFPLSPSSLSVVAYSLDYPEGNVEYTNNLDERDTIKPSHIPGPTACKCTSVCLMLKETVNQINLNMTLFQSMILLII